MKKIHLLKSKKGMTLVEMVGSLAIISILSVFLITVFMFAMTIVSGEAETKKDNAGAAAGLENKIAGFEVLEEEVVIDTTRDTIQIDFGGTIITKSGSYYQSKDGDSDYVYHYFLSD